MIILLKGIKLVNVIIPFPRSILFTNTRSIFPFYEKFKWIQMAGVKRQFSNTGCTRYSETCFSWSHLENDIQGNETIIQAIISQSP